MDTETEGTLEVVRRYCDAWTAGDAATVVGLYADDIVLHYGGDNPLSGDHAGKAAALAVLGRLSRMVERGTPEIHDVMASADHAVVLAKEHWRDAGEMVELERVLLYHVQGGKLSECWVYDTDQPLVDAILSRARPEGEPGAAG